MKATLYSQNGYFVLTRSFDGDSAPSATCEIYNFSKFQAQPVVPAKTRAISDLARDWERHPTRRSALALARNRIADLSENAGDVTIRALRLRAGLSQANVAELIGTVQPHIARIEGGTVQPTMETCRKLAKIYRVDLNAIDRALLALEKEVVA